MSTHSHVDDGPSDADKEASEGARRELAAACAIVDILEPFNRRTRAQVLLAVAVRFDHALTREQLYNLMCVAAGFVP